MGAKILTSSVPDKLIIWGLNDWSAFLAGVLRQLDVELPFVVGSQAEGADFHGAPIVDEQEFRQRYDPATAIPVVVASRSADGRQSDFSRNLVAILNEWGIDCPLHHPAFIKRFVTPSFPGGLGVFGFPSSGNTVINSILGSLLAARDPDAAGLDPVASMIRELCADHIEVLYDAIYHSTVGLGAWGYQLRPNGIGRLEVALGTGARRSLDAERGFLSDGFLYLSGLRAFSHPTRPFYASHEAPDAALRREMASLNYRVVAICRHPLDVLVSLAAKYWRPPDAVLHDADWFRTMATVLRDWWAAALGAGEVPMVRYEDLLAEPVREIHKLAEIAGLPLPSDSYAEELRDQFLFKSLQKPGSPAALLESGHMWKPSAGKWKGLLGEAHVATLEELDYASLLGELGYESDFRGGLGGCPPAEEIAMDRAWLAWHDYTTHLTLGSEVVFRDPGQVFETVSGTDVVIYANDGETAAQLKRSYETPYWRRLLTAI